jgi:hypothetical protein
MRVIPSDMEGNTWYSGRKPMQKIALSLVILVHGLIHIMGFVKAFDLAEINQLTREISRPMGIAWLAATLLFVATLLLYLLNIREWWMMALPALLLSQVVIILHWGDTKFGTLANIIILAAAVVAFGSWRFAKTTETLLDDLLSGREGSAVTVTEEVLASKPAVVATWLQRAGVTGKPAAGHVYLTQRGRMRTTPDGNWMEFTAEQHFITNRPSFLWRVKVNMAPGLHLAGRDTLIEGRGRMNIKLLSLVPVVDARGEAIDQGTLVRFLSEILWFPSAALSDYIRWEELEGNRARAVMTRGDVTVSGIFTFGESGDPSGFRAKRYYDRKGGATLEDWHVSLPADGYREFEGRRVPARASVTWKLDEGDYHWLDLEITSIEYNPGQGETF